MLKKRNLWWLIAISLGITLCLFLPLSLFFQIQQQENELKQANILKLNKILNSNDSCLAPCWNDLVSGQTNLNEYQQFVNKAIGENYILHSEEQQVDGSRFTWSDQDEEWYSSLKFTENGYLEHIDIAAEFEIEALLEQLGTPSHYSSKLITGTASGVSLSFYYENRGIYILFSAANSSFISDSCVLDPLTPFDTRRLLFMEPSDSSQMLVNAFGENTAQKTSIKKWQGIDEIVVEGCS